MTGDLLLILTLPLLVVAAGRLHRRRRVARHLARLAEREPTLSLRLRGRREHDLVLEGDGLMARWSPASLERLSVGPVEPAELLRAAPVDSVVATELRFPADTSKIFPRLVSLPELERIAPLLGPAVRRYGEFEAGVVYVVDRGPCQALIPAKLLPAGFGPSRLHALAMDNLRRTLPRRVIEDAVESRGIRVVQTLDGHDAERVLVLPELLAENERVAALVPDRDTLTLAPAPADGDWRRLDRMARGRERKLAPVVPLLCATPRGLEPVSA